MHFTSSTLFISALLAGQSAFAAYIPHQARAQIVKTEVRTVYSTKIVYASATPESAGINPADGLPLAPSISRLSIPLSSINAANPINAQPVPTVKKTTINKPSPMKKPTSSKKLAPTPTPTKRPAASSAAVGLASLLAQRPKQSATKAAAAGIASLLANLPKVPKPSPPKPASPKPKPTKPPGIVIVPVTLKTTTKPKPAVTTKMPVALMTDSRPTPDKNDPARSMLAMLSAAQNQVSSSISDFCCNDSFLFASLI